MHSSHVDFVFSYFLIALVLLSFMYMKKHNKVQNVSNQI